MSPTTSPAPPATATPPQAGEAKDRKWRVGYIALGLTVILAEAAWVYLLGTLIFRIV